MEYILLNLETLEGEKGNRILTENLGYSFRENREMKNIVKQYFYFILAIRTAFMILLSKISI